MNAKHGSSRPVKAFVVDERGELIREITFDPSSLVSWGQVRGAGALDGYPVRIGYYHAQAVRGGALGVVLVWYGPVPKEVVDFAREILVDIKATLGVGVDTRLHEVREYESRALSLGEELRKRHEALEVRSHAFAEMFDSWASGQAKLAKESAAVHASVAAMEGREGNLAQGWRRLEEARAALGREREEFQALADRLRGELDRRTEDIKERREALMAEETKATEELRALMAPRKEKMKRFADSDIEIETKGQTFWEREAAVKAEENAIRPPDLAAREEALEIEGDRLEGLQREVEQTMAELDAPSRDVAARAASPKGDVDRLGARVSGGEEAVRYAEADTLKRHEIETTHPFLNRQTPEIHEATTSIARRETEQNAADQEQPAATLADREKEVIRRENAQKEGETALQSREAEFVRREAALRGHESKFDDTIRWLEQREAVLGSRTAKLEQELHDLDVLHEETRAEKEFADQTKAAAEAQQAEVTRRMKFLQKKAVEIVDREEELGKRETKVEETESLLDSQVEIVETQRIAMEVDRTESRAKVEQLQAELERLKGRIAESENAPGVVTTLNAEAERDIKDREKGIEDRLRFIQQKGFALLDPEDRLRERED